MLLTSRLTERRATLSTLLQDFLFDLNEGCKAPDLAGNVPARTAQKEPTGHYFKRPIVHPVHATRDLLPIVSCHEKNPPTI